MKRVLHPNHFHYILKKSFQEFKNNNKKLEINILLIDSVIKTALSSIIALKYVNKAIKNALTRILHEIELKNNKTLEETFKRFNNSLEFKFYIVTLQATPKILSNKIYKLFTENIFPKEKDQKGIPKNYIEEENIYLIPKYIIEYDEKNKYMDDIREIQHRREQQAELFFSTNPFSCGTFIAMISSVTNQIKEYNKNNDQIIDILPNKLNLKFKPEVIDYPNLSIKEESLKFWKKYYNDNLKSLKESSKKLKIGNIINSINRYLRDFDLIQFIDLYSGIKSKYIKSISDSDLTEERNGNNSNISVIEFFIMLIGNILNVVMNIRPEQISNYEIHEALYEIMRIGKNLITRFNNMDKTFNYLTEIVNYLENLFTYDYEPPILEIFYAEEDNPEKYLTKTYEFLRSIDKWPLINIGEIYSNLADKLIDQIGTGKNIIHLVADRLSSIVFMMGLLAAIEKLKNDKEKNLNELIVIPHFIREFDKLSPEISEISDVKEQYIFYCVPEFRFSVNHKFTIKMIDDRIKNLKNINFKQFIIGMVDSGGKSQAKELSELISGFDIENNMIFYFSNIHNPSPNYGSNNSKNTKDSEISWGINKDQDKREIKIEYLLEIRQPF